MMKRIALLGAVLAASLSAQTFTTGANPPTSSCVLGSIYTATSMPINQWIYVCGTNGWVQQGAISGDNGLLISPTGSLGLNTSLVPFLASANSWTGSNAFSGPVSFSGSVTGIPASAWSTGASSVYEKQRYAGIGNASPGHALDIASAFSGEAAVFVDSTNVATPDYSFLGTHAANGVYWDWINYNPLNTDGTANHFAMFYYDAAKPSHQAGYSLVTDSTGNVWLGGSGLSASSQSATLGALSNGTVLIHPQALPTCTSEGLFTVTDHTHSSDKKTHISVCGYFSGGSLSWAQVY